jgi:hypothetical protein
MYKAEAWMIWLTAAIALAGLLTFVAALLQWRAIKGQLVEMKRGATDTHNLAVAALKQADAAITLAEQAKLQTKGMEESIDEMEKQAAAMRDAAEASIGANRAWIVPAPTSGQPQPGDAPISLHWVNAGKSPAVNVYSTADFATLHGGADDADRFESGCTKLRKSLNSKKWQVRTSLLLPGGTFEVPLSNAPPGWKNPSAGDETRLLVHGCVWYTDVLTSQERTTEFCYEADRELAGGVLVFPCWWVRREPLRFR